MHDLLLAKEILTTTLKHAKKHKLARLSKIMIELGHMEEHAEEINAENLIELFSMLAQNTPAQNAKLIINPPAGGKKVSGGHWKLIYIKYKK